MSDIQLTGMNASKFVKTVKVEAGGGGVIKELYRLHASDKTQVIQRMMLSVLYVSWATGKRDKGKRRAFVTCFAFCYKGQ